MCSSGVVKQNKLYYKNSYDYLRSSSMKDSNVWGHDPVNSTGLKSVKWLYSETTADLGFLNTYTMGLFFSSNCCGSWRNSRWELSTRPGAGRSRPLTSAASRKCCGLLEWQYSLVSRRSMLRMWYIQLEPVLVLNYNP